MLSAMEAVVKRAVTVLQAPIPHRFLDAATLLHDPGTDMASKMANALADLRSLGATRLVMDMRGNDGGDDEQVLEAGQALPLAGQRLVLRRLVVKELLPALPRAVHVRRQPRERLQLLGVGVEEQALGRAEVPGARERSLTATDVSWTGRIRSSRRRRFEGRVSTRVACWSFAAAICMSSACGPPRPPGAGGRPTGKAGIRAAAILTKNKARVVVVLCRGARAEGAQGHPQTPKMDTHSTPKTQNDTQKIAILAPVNIVDKFNLQLYEKQGFKRIYINNNLKNLSHYNFLKQPIDTKIL